MFNLIYKDFKLAVHPFFLLLPIITGALMLIPGWLYLLVFMYFSFISVPNIFANYKTNNDLILSNLMPVVRKDIVLSRMLSIIILEILHIVIAIFFAYLNYKFYDNHWFIFILPNVAYFALAFIMYGIFNVVLFPLYFRTGYYYGFATSLAVFAMVAFAGAAEYFALKNQWFHDFLRGSQGLLSHVSVLIVGIILFILLNVISYIISKKRFEKADL
jgi:hypothetical protein